MTARRCGAVSRMSRQFSSGGVPCPVPSGAGTPRPVRYSAVLGGAADLRLPLLFTAGVPHRLTCALKADRPAEVTLALEGRFDGQAAEAREDGPGGRIWADVSLDIALPAAVRSELSFSVKVPKGVRILLNAVRFVPVALRKESRPYTVVRGANRWENGGLRTELNPW